MPSLRLRLRSAFVARLTGAAWLATFIAGCGGTTPASTFEVGPVPLAVEVTRGSLKRRADRNAAAPRFWSAIALVDGEAAERGASTVEERLFASGFRALIDGREDESLVVFETLSRSDEPGIRAAANTGRTLVLQSQGRWRDLAALGDPTQEIDRASIFLWARAFAGLAPTSVRISASTARLPLRLSSAGTPVVTIRINGSERNFWLDTGASLSIIAADVARELGVPVVWADTLAVATWGGRVPARAAVVDRLELGPMIARSVPVAVLDENALRFDRSAPIGSFGGPFRLDGVIGADLMRHLAMTLDVRARTITLARPPRRDAGRSRNLFWLGFPVVRLTAASGSPTLFGLDTGADSSTVGEGWLLVDTTGKVSSRRGELVGLGATSVSTLQAVREVLLSDGAFTVRLRNVTVAPERRSTFVTMDGVLGADFIRAAEVHIDLTNGIFSVRPPRPAPQLDAITVTSH